MSSGHDPIDTLARRATAALEDAARVRAAGAPDPDELRAVQRRRRMRQRIAAGVAAAAAVAVLVGAGTGLLPDRFELWIEDVVGQPDKTEPVPPDDASEQSTDEAFEVPGSWTVDTSLGIWTWTWVPERDGADDLRNEADARFRSETELANRAELIDLASVPDIAGMAWTTDTHWPFTPAERIDPEAEMPDVAWATRGGVTVGVVGAYGTIDWGSMYGNPEAYTRWDASARTVAVTLGWDEHPVAELDVSLVPGNPEAVEFHDQHTGELVLRLEATDPAVSAAQLVAQGGHPGGYQRGSACWTGLPGCTGVVWSLAVDSGDGFQPAEPPWRQLPIDLVDVTVGPDGFVAVGVGPADWPAGDRTPVLHRWASSDGVDWHELATPLALPFEGPPSRLQVIGDHSRLVMSLAVDEPTTVGDRTSLWTSTDGVTWQRLGIDPDAPSTHAERADWARLTQTDVTAMARTGFGWALSGGVNADCDVWVSVDGEAWERVRPPPQILSRDRLLARTYCRLVGDDLYARVEEGQALVDGNDDYRPLGLWIGQLDG